LRAEVGRETIAPDSGRRAVTDANVLVMRRATILWVGATLMMTFNMLAAFGGSERLVMWALALSGAFAVVGIAFGVWAGLKVARRP
jgi:hypothetical protein